MWPEALALVLVGLTSAFVTSPLDYHWRGWRDRRRVEAS